ncbi:NUDIX hydrolase [Stenotrophomonas sp.]|uniref:NUDIX hydrolase n=1 Tax=Stenotrophomonas sp. TaxID=69392 RepID=UPI002FC88772
MTQVYVTIRSGDQFLIARKQVTNAWWSSTAAAVLLTEAASKLVTLINVAPGTAVSGPDLATCTGLLKSAAVAAVSAWSNRRTTPAEVTARTAVQRASTEVTSAVEFGLAALQGALPAVLSAIDAVAAVGVARPSLAPPTAPWVPVATPPVTAWPDTTLQARVDAAMVAVQTWATAQAAVVVNQAWQWALPGGGKSDTETADAAARREFMEETGFVLDAGFVRSFSQEFSQAPNRVDFILFCFEVPADVTLADMAAVINQNLAARSTWLGRPVGSGVVDWELNSVSLLAKDQLTTQLGMAQPVTLPGTPRPESQSIDWYLRMAQYIQTQP